MKFISITWATEDIQPLMEEVGLRYTEDSAYQILKYARDNHDANVGINWDVLRDVVDMFKTNEESTVVHSINLPRIFLPASLVHVTYSDMLCRVSIFGVDGNLMYEDDSYLTSVEESDDEDISKIASYLLEKYIYLK